MERTDLEGITVSAWMKRGNAQDLFGTAWAFTTSTPIIATNQERLFLTLNSYIGYTNKVDTFAINYACNHPTGDFEDDAMYHVAKLSFCDVIVTSDKLFKERHQGEDPNIQIMTPEEFVAKITVS